MRAEFAGQNSIEKFKFSRAELGARRINGLEAECEALEAEFSSVKEEFDSIQADNNEMEEIYYRFGGLLFGGSKALERRKNDEKAMNYEEKLEEIRDKIRKDRGKNEGLRKKLTALYGERDRLLTRIQILQQAVTMMHGGNEKEQKQEQMNLPPSPTFSSTQHSPDDIRGPGSSPPSFPFPDLLPSPRIPEFLRFGGFYRSQPLSLYLTELRVKEIWSLKSLADQKARQMGEQTMEFIDFVQKYFESQPAYRGNLGKCREALVNFLSVMEAPSNVHSIDFLLFRLCLFGIFHESHFADLQLLVASLKEALARWDTMGEENEFKEEQKDQIPQIAASKLSSRPSIAVMRTSSFITSNSLSLSLLESEGETEERDGLIEWIVFQRELRKFFPLKSPERFQSLLDSARQLSWVEYSEQIDSKVLLRPIDEFNSSQWIQLVSIQYIQECLEYRRKIRDEALKRAQRKIGINVPVSPHAVKLTAKEYFIILKRVDPLAAPSERLELVKRGMKDPFFSKNSETDVLRFICNLANSGIVTIKKQWNKKWDIEKIEESAEE